MSNDSGIDNKRQADIDDLQREIAGLDVGRMTRFLSENDPRSVAGKRKNAEERAFRTVLDQLLQDAAYKALYIDLGQKLGAAKRDADDMLSRIDVDLVAIAERIAEMENDAGPDPDGAPVFRYVDGRVVDTNNEVIPIEIAEGIMWPDDAPSAEEYFGAKQEQAVLQDRQREWSGYRTDVLGDVRNRYDDADAPMSKDDMQKALDEIEQSRPTALTLNVAHDANTPAAVPMPAAFPDFN